MRFWYTKTVVLPILSLIIGCGGSSNSTSTDAPSLPTSTRFEDLEDDASKTGDWVAVERREELDKKRLESTAPGCSVGQYKDCVEEQTGIVCYCRIRADENVLD